MVPLDLREQRVLPPQFLAQPVLREWPEPRAQQALREQPGLPLLFPVPLGPLARKALLVPLVLRAQPQPCPALRGLRGPLAQRALREQPEPLAQQGRLLPFPAQPEPLAQPERLAPRERLARLALPEQLVPLLQCRGLRVQREPRALQVLRVPLVPLALRVLLA